MSKSRRFQFDGESSSKKNKAQTFKKKGGGNKRKFEKEIEHNEIEDEFIDELNFFGQDDFYDQNEFFEEYNY